MMDRTNLFFFKIGLEEKLFSGKVCEFIEAESSTACFLVLTGRYLIGALVHTTTLYSQGGRGTLTSLRISFFFVLSRRIKLSGS